jgi:hypothetical protein
MGFDLSNKQGQSWHFNISDWPDMLHLAELYGWEPEGTTLDPEHLASVMQEEDLPPEEAAAQIAQAQESWQGGYGTNDFQVVSAQDAAALADALERALPDLPKYNALEHKGRDVSSFPPELCDQLRALGVSQLIPADADINPFERFSGRGRDYLRGFIAFCRAGAFNIA